MCKFQQPQIPANVTADERRAIYFDALYSLDLSDKVGLSSKDAIPQLLTGLSKIRRPTFHILQILVSVSWSIQK